MAKSFEKKILRVFISFTVVFCCCDSASSLTVAYSFKFNKCDIIVLFF